MIVCPNCSSADIEIESGVCSSCSWERRDVDGIPDYLSDAQRKSEISSDYNQNYEDIAKKNLVESNIDRSFLNKQSIKLAEYLGDVRGRSICEIGIGQGFLCRELLRRDAKKIVAIDVAVSYLSVVKDEPKVTVFLANAETLPFEDEFDFLVSTDVMEHVLNVGSFLYCVNRALKPGGTAAIRVPYREGLLNYSPHKGYAHDFGHLRSFNKDILKIYVEQAGMKLRGFRLDGYSPFTPREWAMRSAFGIWAVSKIQRYLARRYSHWSEVIELPRPIVKLFFRPVEIVVLAEKVVQNR